MNFVFVYLLLSHSFALRPNKNSVTEFDLTGAPNEDIVQNHLT